MAYVAELWGFITLMDSRKKTATVRWRASDELDFETFVTAETDLIRNATDLAGLAAAVAALSGCSEVSRGAIFEQIDDAMTPPGVEEHVFTFDKLLVSYDAGIEGYNLTIPGRKGDAYTVGSDGVTVIIEGAGAAAAVTNVITAFEAGALAKNGEVPDVQEMIVAR
jgi:hypothetical protein